MGSGVDFLLNALGQPVICDLPLQHVLAKCLLTPYPPATCRPGPSHGLSSGPGEREQVTLSIMTAARVKHSRVRQSLNGAYPCLSSKSDGDDTPLHQYQQGINISNSNGLVLLTVPSLIRIHLVQLRCVSIAQIPIRIQVSSISIGAERDQHLSLNKSCSCWQG